MTDGSRLFVTALLTGPGILSYRLRRKQLGSWLQEANRRLHGAGHGAGHVDGDRDRSRVPIELAYSIGPAISVSLDAVDIASHDLERWTRDHFIDKIPGGRHAPE